MAGILVQHFLFDSQDVSISISRIRIYYNKYYVFEQTFIYLFMLLCKKLKTSFKLEFVVCTERDSSRYCEIIVKSLTACIFIRKVFLS